jgi:hypothetical protein
MEDRPPQCNRKKQGLTMDRGRSVWGLSISFHLSRLQWAPPSSSLKHNGELCSDLLPFLWHKIVFRTKGQRRWGEQVLILARCTVSRKNTLDSFVRCFNSNLLLDSCIQNYLPVLQTFFVMTFVNLDCGLLGYDAISAADVYQRFGSTYHFHLQD